MPHAPLPFAHAFFTDVPPASRKVTATTKRFGQRMRDFAKDNLEPIPQLVDDPVWTLDKVIGADRASQIEQAGAIRFHAVGDTGAGAAVYVNNAPSQFKGITNQVLHVQEEVARRMNEDFHAALPGQSPAFFFHLGDVNYFENTPTGYHDQFYVPYELYSGKIVAIPGNHDGEVMPDSQPSSLFEFMKNFCPPEPEVPPAAKPVFREMSPQPGPFWWLRAPFLDLIGLYSNVAEGPGYLRGGNAGEHQYEWFLTVLERIAQQRAGGGSRKALVIGVHHPPMTAKFFTPSDTGHSPSEEMDKDMLDAFQQKGILPDAVLAGHAHNYQRFTRVLTLGSAAKKVPYIVAGGGGRLPQALTAANQQQSGGVTYEHSHHGHGYLLLTASASSLQINYTPVSIGAGDPGVKDSVTVHF